MIHSLIQFQRKNPIVFIRLSTSCALFLLMLFTPFSSSSFAQEEKAPALSLSDAVDLSLEQNRELIATRFDFKASEHSKSEARSGYFPQVSFESNFSKIDSDRYDFDIPSDSPFADLFNVDQLGITGTNYTNSFKLQQLIFDRSVIGRIKLADLQSMAASWQEKGQEQTVVFETVSAYLDVMRAQELMNVQKQRLALADKQLNTAKTNFEVGLRIRTDVLRAELTRSSALRDLVSAEIAFRNAKVKLNEILGVPIDQEYQFLEGSLASYNPPAESMETFQHYDNLFLLAETSHPSIRVASFLVDQYEESVKIARGEFAPRASIGASWGFNENDRISFEDEEWAVQLGVQVPIFEGGRKIAKVRRTKAELEAQKNRYDDTVRIIKTLVEQSALALQEEQRNLEIAIQAEIVATENHERFLNLYEEGLADSLDVTQALTELVEAQTDVVTTRYGYLIVYSQLLNAVGMTPIEGETYSNLDWLSTL
ncbi:MAG: TolC family protein [Candidatus Omnitrophica bacterium]|nr:TolC family protein [Candidatus Omnitrophota bacterium]